MGVCGARLVGRGRRLGVATLGSVTVPILNSKVVSKPPTTETGVEYHTAPMLSPPVAVMSCTRMTLFGLAVVRTWLSPAVDEKSG